MFLLPLFFCISLFSVFFFFLSFCPSTFRHWEDTKENVYQTFFIGRSAMRSLGKPRTRNRSTEETCPGGQPLQPGFIRAPLPSFEEEAAKALPLYAGGLPFPFGGSLLCELMTVIITSPSSFVISKAKPQSGGSGLPCQMKVFMKQIAV